MTIDDINEAIAAFGGAARRAVEAGFDGVEIHCAHGYLLTQFLSALSNQRSDQYGGATIKERSRLVIEVIRAVRKAVGAEFPSRSASPQRNLSRAAIQPMTCRRSCPIL